MEGNGECVKPTKITLIETRCVKVEAKDFKSMVQSLTGVNSSVAWIGNTSLQKERKRSSPPPVQPQQLQRQSHVAATSRAGVGGSVCLGGNANNVNYNFDNNGSGGFSTVDLDEMLQGLPLMEEYHLQNWSWDNVKEGLDVCVDLTWSSPLTQSGLSNFVPSRTVSAAAQRDKYGARCRATGYGFLPFFFSSMGESEKDVIALLKRVQAFAKTQDIGARAAAYIFSKIGPIGLRTLLTLGYCNRIIVGDPVPRKVVFSGELKYSPERDCHSLITEKGNLRLDQILPILDERPASYHYFMLCVKFAVWGLEFYNEENGSIISPEYQIVAALPYSNTDGMVDGERHSIYHANFLAGRVKNKTSPYPEIQLFFVELWGDKIINADDRGDAVRRCQILKPCLLNTGIGGVTTYAKGGIFHPLEVPCSTCHPIMYPWMESSARSPI